MCTALTLQTKDKSTFFGRSMDVEYSFNQSVLIVPRKYPYRNVVDLENRNTKYAIIGIGTTMQDYPMLADGANEAGLACAALNFPGFAKFEEDIVNGMVNLAPHDVILWGLANFKTVDEVKENFKNVNIVKQTFTRDTFLAPLHWIFTDKSGKSVVIEKTADGLKIFDNEIGILGNSPNFDWHMTNLRQYIGLNPNQKDSINLNGEVLSPLGQGTGLFGLPGDFTPPSRFVRTALLKANMVELESESQVLNEFFHILNNVSMVSGSVITPQGLNDITQYTSCINIEKGIYYYNTYYNSRLNAIDMHKENLDSDKLILFPYLNALDINYQN